MRLVALVSALLAFPSLAFAACEGRDWRTQLAPETVREIRARLAHVPFHRGIAFEAVRGESRLTLFGTVHVYDRGVYVPDAIADRIRSADLVLVEATPEVMASFRQRLAEDYALSFDVSGPRLRSRLIPDALQIDSLSQYVVVTRCTTSIDCGDRVSPSEGDDECGNADNLDGTHVGRAP